jgi:hypothetical protein
MPAPYRSRLEGHEVVLASELGWEALSNGKLLDAAEAADFPALISIDKGIAHQQHIAKRTVSIILLDTFDARIAVLDLLAADLLITLSTLEIGRLYVLKVQEDHG